MLSNIEKMFPFPFVLNYNRLHTFHGLHFKSELKILLQYKLILIQLQNVLQYLWFISRWSFSYKDVMDDKQTPWNDIATTHTGSGE